MDGAGGEVTTDVSTAPMHSVVLPVVGVVSSRSLYAAAAALVPSIVPYTIVTMVGINDKLMAKAQDGGKTAVSDAETRELLRRWARLNYGRMVIVLAGSLLGCVATVMR